MLHIYTHTQGITSECVGVYINVSRQNTFQQKITINNKEIETRRVLKMGDRRVFLFLISNRNMQFKKKCKVQTMSFLQRTKQEADINSPACFINIWTMKVCMINLACTVCLCKSEICWYWTCLRFQEETLVHSVDLPCIHWYTI